MSILDDIMDTLKGIETSDSTLVDNEGGENFDIFKSADIDSSFASFIESWNDPEKRTEYGALKESFLGEYMADPANLKKLELILSFYILLLCKKAWQRKWIYF